MNTAATSSGFFHIGPRGAPDPREADGWGPGVALAVGVHLVLVAALALGVHWKMATPDAMEAEVWAEIPRAVAPEPPPPPPVEEKPVEKTVEPAPEPEQPVQESIPDLVVSKKLTKKEKKPRKHETIEVFEDTKPPKVVAKPVKQPEPKKPAPPPEKPVVSKVTKPDNSAKAAAEREAQRNAHMQRMMNELGALGTSSQSAGPSANYAGRIKARIRANIKFVGTVTDNNAMTMIEVYCAPDGRIIGSKQKQSSGDPAFDNAVARAIEWTQVLPADENGKVPAVILVTFRPNDL
jgi:colicin import membrane protein